MKSSITTFCLSVSLISNIFLFSSCASKRPIILENVYAQPGIDFGVYKKVAVAEFIPSPEIKDEINFTFLVEDEFLKNGYDVVDRDEFNSVLDEFGYSSEDVLDPDALKKVGERLGVKAIIRGEVQQFESKNKKDHTPLTVGEGFILIEETKYICDISMNIEMIETKEGNKVWSCSVSCSERKGKPEQLVRNMIRDSLDTMLKR
jgi:hypothetical protein